MWISFKNIDKDVCPRTVFRAPTIQPDENIDRYYIEWSQLEDAYVISKRSNPSFGKQNPFPLEATRRSMDEFITGRTEAKMIARFPESSKSPVSSSVEVPVCGAHASDDNWDTLPSFEQGLRTVAMTIAGAEEENVSCGFTAAHVLDQARVLAKHMGVIPDLEVVDTFTTHKTSATTEQQMNRDEVRSRVPKRFPVDRKQDWESPLLGLHDAFEGAPEGYVNPYSEPLFYKIPYDTHHINFNNMPVREKSDTAPEVSLWAATSTGIRYHTHDGGFSRESILAAQAAKYADPIHYTGPPEHLKLTGSKMREAVIGLVLKTYPPVGHWTHDYYGPDENVPHLGQPGTAFFNSSNWPLLPVPYYIYDGDMDHTVPHINARGSAIRPYPKRGWRSWCPSPLRQEIRWDNESRVEEATGMELKVEELKSIEIREETPELLSDGESSVTFSSLSETGSSCGGVLDGPQSSTPSPNSTSVDSIDIAALPNIEDCITTGLSPATQRLLALVTHLKEQYPTAAGQTISKDDTKVACEAQSPEDVDDENGFLYGEVDTLPEPGVFKETEPLNELQWAPIARDPCHDKTAFEKGEEGLTSAPRSSSDRAGSEAAERTPEKQCTTEDDHSGALVSVGKWICAGSAVAVAGIFLYRRCRR